MVDYFSQITLVTRLDELCRRRARQIRPDHLHEWLDIFTAKLRTIRLAQQAGFTMAEIQTWLHDFPAGTLPAARWEAMARQKLANLEERMHTIRTKKALLGQTLQCQCETLDECGANMGREM